MTNAAQEHAEGFEPSSCAGPPHTLPSHMAWCLAPSLCVGPPDGAGPQTKESQKQNRGKPDAIQRQNKGKSKANQRQNSYNGFSGHVAYIKRS